MPARESTQRAYPPAYLFPIPVSPFPPTQNVLLGIVLQCSVQCPKKAPKIALHPDVGEGAKPAGSSLQAGFFISVGGYRVAAGKCLG